MFFILSRIFAFVAEPLTYIILAFCLAIFLPAKLKKVRLSCAIVAIGLTLFFTNPMIYSSAERVWAPPHQHSNDTTHYDWGVVLGGFGHYDSESGMIDYQRAIDRLFSAVRYYRCGRIDKIVITGDGLTTDSATFYREMEHIFHIPSHDIIREPLAKSTRQNAQCTAQLLKQYNNPRIAVFTSAIHIPRTRLTFQQEGVEATFIPCDYRSRNSNPYIMWMPNFKVLNDWSELCHEWIGYAAYFITK